MTFWNISILLFLLFVAIHGVGSMCTVGYDLERHKERMHGDVCRAASGHFVCPQPLCAPTLSGRAPYCVSADGSGKPCRMKKTTHELTDQREKANQFLRRAEKRGDGGCPPGTTIERHDHWRSHGDVCRASDGSQRFTCPRNFCAPASGGGAPFCINVAPREAREKDPEPCRAPRRLEDRPYVCDVQGGERGVCILATGDLEGHGTHATSTCDGACSFIDPTKRRSQSGTYLCRSDLDCSLAGLCNKETGQCACDHWATGQDCSLLSLAPVDRDRMGYFPAEHTTWCGSVTAIAKHHDEISHNRSATFRWLMISSEILCPRHSKSTWKQGRQRRCGLEGWKTRSQLVEAVSEDHPAGPYMRRQVVAKPMHHNPELFRDPKTAELRLYATKGDYGPTVVMRKPADARDDDSWTREQVVSRFDNPAPATGRDGKTLLFSRQTQNQANSIGCAAESIAMQTCRDDDLICSDEPRTVFTHPAEGAPPL